jgi:hypothetical protein
VGKGDRGDREAPASQSPSSGGQLAIKQEPTKNNLVVFRKTVSTLLFYTPIDEAVVNRG